MKKILVVDDEQLIREQLGVALRKAFNCEVLLAANGVEALAKFEVHRKDIPIVVSDIQMPIMDGLELLKKIRAKDENLPVIIISATAINKDFKNMGVVIIVNKPFGMENLMAVVKRHGFPE